MVDTNLLASLRPLDRHRAQQLMAEREIDGLVLIQPESIVYGSGGRPGSAAGWRRAGAAFLIVPADSNAPITAIIGDFYAEEFSNSSGIEDIFTFPVWVDLIDIRDTAHLPLRERLDHARPSGSRARRPTTYDGPHNFALLHNVLNRRGLASARLGTEYAFLPVADAEAFQSACPNVRWSDVSKMLCRLRMIKTPEEIARLTLAGRAAEAGVAAVLTNLRPGLAANDLWEMFRSLASIEASRLGYGGRLELSGSITVGPTATGPGRTAQLGDVVRLDLGCSVDGYTSDCARTATIGRPHPDAKDIYEALHAAFEAGLQHLRPGNRLCDVYHAARHAMHEQGFEMYNRGHFGHGIGASVFVEEWPFIAADQTQIIEPGMVLAYELPWYIRGLGAFMLEDQFVIGDRSAEPCWSLTREMVTCL